MKPEHADVVAPDDEAAVKWAREDYIREQVLRQHQAYAELQAWCRGREEGGVTVLDGDEEDDVVSPNPPPRAHTKNKAPEESGARGTRNTQFLNTRSQSHPSLSPPTHNTYPKPNPPTPPPRICAPPPQISSSFPSRHGISDPGLPSLIPHSRRSSNIPLTSSNASRRAESEEQQHRPPASSSSVVRHRGSTAPAGSEELLAVLLPPQAKPVPADSPCPAPPPELNMCIQSRSPNSSVLTIQPSCNFCNGWSLRSNLAESHGCRHRRVQENRE
ncbi:formin-like protein 3 [Triticum dicoccoides]|uniref:formin-like protein 3 n=1 Tax=Triticum dicoccoides TaxID=85692 RepID=UPI00188FC3E1|nr:formin-like protein 3 [Triticum dicoccoides]